jgi:TPR repeat protein
MSKENADELFNIAVEAYNREDYKKAFSNFKKAAKQGHAEAQTKLAQCYKFGDGVKQNYFKTVEWLLKAVEQNHAEAQYNLAEHYYRGLGDGALDIDYAKAGELYLKSAENGNADAQMSIGIYYYNALGGFAKDKNKAFEWWIKAAEQGEVIAQNKLKYTHKKEFEKWTERRMRNEK